MTRTHHPEPTFQLRLVAGRDVVIGPGKADLLTAIDRTGSISAASRELGMSYKKAWQLIDTMNRHLPERAVETTTGGRERGGAHLTPLGREVLARFRALEALVDPARSDDAGALQSLVARGGGTA